MEENRMKELSKIYENIVLSNSLPWWKDFETKEEREEYIRNTYNGATIPELLSIGIDPFK